MAIKGEDFAKMSKEQVKAIFKPSLCPICGEPLQMYEKHQTSRGVICSDCYFDLLGDEVEQHPVGLPRRK